MAKAPRESEEERLLPYPEETLTLAGQERAETELLSALKSGRMHHAWMLTGPRGIGKATLAFRFARFLLRYGNNPAALASAASLDVPEDDPASVQIARGTTQDLLVLRRGVDEKTGKEKTEITVDVTARLQPFFNLAAGRGGWRVAIVDPVDDLNRNAANALLKSLEEPPTRAILLLVTHAPGRTLATIRSRCRKLALEPLPADVIRTELARIAAARNLATVSPADETLIAELAGGSLGRALELRLSGGLAQYRALLKTLKAWPNISEAAIQTLLDAILARQFPDAFSIAGRLIVDTVRATACAAAGDPAKIDPALDAMAKGGAAWAWADLASDLESLFAKGEGLNLEERAVVAEALRRIAAVRYVAA